MFLLGALEALLTTWLDTAVAPLHEEGAVVVGSADLQGALRSTSLSALLSHDGLAAACNGLLDESTADALRAAGVLLPPRGAASAEAAAALARRKDDPVSGSDLRALLRRLNPGLSLSEGATTLLAAFSRAWLEAAAADDARHGEAAPVEVLVTALVPPQLLKRCVNAGELNSVVLSGKLSIPSAVTLRFQQLSGAAQLSADAPFVVTVPRRAHLQPAFDSAAAHYGMGENEAVFLYHGAPVDPGATADLLGVIARAPVLVVTAEWWAERQARRRGDDGGAGGGGGGGGEYSPPQRAAPHKSAAEIGSALESATSKGFKLVARGFGGGDGGGEEGGGRSGGGGGVRAGPMRGIRNTGGGLGTSPEAWGRQPRLLAASSAGKEVSGRDAVLLLNAVLASLGTLEEAVGSLESLSRALPGLSESAGDGAMLDIRALHATAAAITTAGRDLKEAVTTVEGNLARQALLDDTRKFAGRLQKKSPGVRALRAKSVGPFGSPVAKGLSPRR